MMLAQITTGQWILFIFVGLFMLLMLAGLVTWVVQVVRGGRRYRRPKSRKRDKVSGA